MEKHIPTYEEAKELFLKYNKTESLINHGKAVEAVMRYLAKKHGEDEEKWGIIGLVHDLDYEQYPEQHCTMTKQILENAGWDEEYIRAIISHGWGICSDSEPQTLLEKSLYAIDELTGLITACALVRPSKSVMDMEVSSVKKKWKQKAFAAGANREVILKGAEMLGVTLEELIQDTIDGMKTMEG
ncbi:HDIG domain-containing protein [Bacteroidetes/Chlorobi group bacterium ChocPot_Mid]|jgi:putative nucleotidyltransferase with HDIG domain|nr:MAG: HDIG domain-containing protein [Bacteroidetes/Chlorobi group bacterium ChocPot_Mid]